MPFTFKVIVICFGALFFIAHLAWAACSVRFYTARNDKLESLGKAVPGFAGLLLVTLVLLPPSGWSVVCAVAAISLMIVGRAVYELIVFRK